jgi:hypothetical protein
MLAIFLVHCHKIQTSLFYQKGTLLHWHVMCSLVVGPFCLVARIVGLMVHIIVIWWACLQVFVCLVSLSIVIPGITCLGLVVLHVTCLGLVVLSIICLGLVVLRVAFLGSVVMWECYVVMVFVCAIHVHVFLVCFEVGG